MAKREKPVVMDGVATPVYEDSRISDVVPREATEIVTSKGEVIPRAEFARRPIPGAFDVNWSSINKGAGRAGGCPGA
ncbi:MAG: hypothetical protein ACKVQQ_14375 [Burkholderiales bacterium]